MNLPDFLIALENLFFASFAVGNQKSTRTEKVMKKFLVAPPVPRLKIKPFRVAQSNHFCLNLKTSNDEKLFFGLKATRISLK